MEELDILIVEDDESVRNWYSLLFELLPYSFKIASNGEDAVILSNIINFKLFIIDIRLVGELNGVELSLLLRNKNKNIKILAMTGYPNLFADYSPALVGIDKVYEKPLGFKQMLEDIKDFFKK